MGTGTDVKERTVELSGNLVLEVVVIWGRPAGYSGNRMFLVSGTEVVVFRIE